MIVINAMTSIFKVIPLHSKLERKLLLNFQQQQQQQQLEDTQASGNASSRL